MSSQIIPLKSRTDFRSPAEFQPQRLFAFELRRWGIRSSGPVPRSRLECLRGRRSLAAMAGIAVRRLQIAGFGLARSTITAARRRRKQRVTLIRHYGDFDSCRTDGLRFVPAPVRHSGRSICAHGRPISGRRYNKNGRRQCVLDEGACRSSRMRKRCQREFAHERQSGLCT